MGPISEYSDLARRWCEAAESNADMTKRSELYEETKKIMSKLEKVKTKEEAQKCTNEFLSTFQEYIAGKSNKQGMEKTEIFARWIGSHTGDSVEGPQGAYPSLHSIVEHFEKVNESNTKHNISNVSLEILKGIDKAAQSYVYKELPNNLSLPDEMILLIVSDYLRTHPTKEITTIKLVSRKTQEQAIQAYRGTFNELGMATAIQAIEYVKSYGNHLEFADISNIQFTENEFAEFTSLVPNLTTLIAKKCGLNPRDMEKLADSEMLTNLRTLMLGGNLIGKDGVVFLTASGKLNQLERLDLSSNDIGREGAIALAKCPQLTNLEIFDLSDNKIGKEGAAALAASDHLLKLVALSLSHNHLNNDGVAAFAVGSPRPSLIVLDLSSNAIGDSGLTALAESKRMSTLEILDLHDNGIQNTGIANFVLTLNFPHLRTLDLSSNLIEKEGAAAIAASTYFRLKVLNLNENRLGNEGVKRLFSSRHLQNLITLNLENNEIDHLEIKGISLKKFPNLVFLNLSRNPLENGNVDSLKSEFPFATF